MRKTTGIVVASALLLTLSACAGASGPVLDGGSAVDPASCTPSWARGGLALDVEATGDFGATPVAATFPDPFVSKNSVSTAILEQGDGAQLGTDAIVGGTMTIFDGATGDVLTQTQSTTLIPLGSANAPFFDGAECATVGSRVVAVGPALALLGDAITSQNSIDPEMTVVSVLDIQRAYITRAQGASQAPQNGLPTVSHAANGQPGLSFTNAKAPTDLRIETLIAGNGTTVKEGDNVLLNYTGVIWDTHDVFDSSWDRGAPASFTTDQVVEGFSKALIGHTVGSQVLTTVPPEFGYGDSPPDGSGIKADSTLVFVIDILGVLPPV